MLLALAVIAAVVTGLGGYRAGLLRDRHSATGVVLTGMITWSNEESRRVVFETDGVVRDPDDGDAVYSIVAHDWEDAAGTIHADGSYPTCLAEAASPAGHRAELTVIDWDAGGAQRVHVAVRVRCLD
ncbi:hypothetical protein [Micromonospora endophytica]|uniref:hypothetical protein n=1 Tax=Micromonospora endophytica TaxID=515350 RepID=UPI001CB9B78A|nr:hypothetical protein [Micromonospora endophytica]